MSILPVSEANHGRISGHTARFSIAVDAFSQVG